MWIRRHDPTAVHRCAPPTCEHVYRLPDTTTSTLTLVYSETAPDGHRGDLWQCPTCSTLWRIGYACDWCDWRQPHESGLCTVGTAWRRASWWTRMRYFLAGRCT